MKPKTILTLLLVAVGMAMQAQIINLGNPESFNTLLKENFAGKTVYIDIMASWCKPCLMELPASKELDEYFNENNIVRLFVTIDNPEDIDNCIKLLNKYNLSGYLVAFHQREKRPQNKFAKEVETLFMRDEEGNFAIKIPQYAIADEQGNIVIKKAERPSNPDKLKRQFQEITIYEKDENSETNLRKTVVCGTVINQTNETAKVITVIACDPLDNNDRYATRLNSTGKFRAEFKMLWGHSFTINYDKRFINLYAAPGDSVYIEIDAAKFKENSFDALQFGGDNKTRNKEFSHTFNDLIHTVNYDAFPNLSMPLNDFMKVFEKEVKFVNDTITTYCNKNHISLWTQNLMQDMSLYTLSNYALNYKGQSWQDELNFFTQPIFDIFNNEKFKNMMFPYHLESYFGKLIAGDTIIAGYYKNNKLFEATAHGEKLIKSMPMCLSRDFMLYKFYNKIGVGAGNIHKNDFYNKGVYDKLLAVSKPQENKDLPAIVSGEGAFRITDKGKVEHIANFSFEKLIKEKYSGKVVYVDIWAAWCAPCREEMTPARELHKLFREKEIAFVNICMSSKQKDWLKLINSGEVEGDNYFFDDDLSSEAITSLAPGGFPSYILIDKTGNIRDKNAPRPSALSDAGNAIDKLLWEE